MLAGDDRPGEGSEAPEAPQAPEQGLPPPAEAASPAPAGPGAPPGVHSDLERLLREVAGTIRQRGRRALAGLGITPPQFDALNALQRGGEMTMGELCDRLQVASSTVTDLVDRMERSELVRRNRDCSDRRVVRLRITDRGSEVIEEVLRTRAAYLSSVLDRLSPSDQVLVDRAIRLLHEHVTGPGAP